MSSKTIFDRLREAGLEPCEASQEWASSYTDASAAWKECKNGSWMGWYVGSVAAGDPDSEQRRKFVMCLYNIVVTAMPHTKDVEAICCLDVVGQWLERKAPAETLKRAPLVCWTYAESAIFQVANAVNSVAEAARAGDRVPAEISMLLAANRSSPFDKEEYAAIRRASLLASANVFRAHYPDPPILG